MGTIKPIINTITIFKSSTVLDGYTAADVERLEGVQLTAARIVTGAMPGTTNAKLYEELGWQALVTTCSRKNSKLTLMYKIVNKLVPNSLQSVIPTIINPETQHY